jgi:hypothetical protein
MHYEGFAVILGPPGCYIAYACMYLTTCLLKIFNLATCTFEEQQSHIKILQDFSNRLLARSANNGTSSNAVSRSVSTEYVSQLNQSDLVDDLNANSISLNVMDDEDEMFGLVITNEDDDRYADCC